MKMKIGYLFTYGYSLKTWEESGTLNKELFLFKKLVEEKNIEFKLFTYGNADDFKLLPKNLNIEIVPIYDKIFKRSENKKINLLKSLVLPFKLKKYFSDVDVIKCNQLQGSWVAVILKMLLRKPLYLRTGYDVYSFSVYEEKGNFKITSYFILTQIALFFSDLYSVTTELDKKFLVSKFKFTKNIILRPNFVLSNEIKPIEERFSKKILSVGRLENQKNFEKLILLFKNTDYEIDIVGEGSLKGDLINISKNNNVKVNFLGQIENNELQNIYSKYLFFISTSNFEGHPKTILEALSNGCIVLASNIPNHLELIEDSVNGFIIHNSIVSIKDKLNDLKSDFSKLKIISDNAVDNAESEYGIDTLINNLEKDYFDITNKSGYLS